MHGTWSISSLRRMSRPSTSETLLRTACNRRRRPRRVRADCRLSCSVRASGGFASSRCVYALVFFLSSFLLPPAVGPKAAPVWSANPLYWLPDVVSIVLALAVALFTRMPTRVPVSVVLNLGLVFLVVSSYGIAIAEYIDPMQARHERMVGLSWVAVWTPLYVGRGPDVAAKGGAGHAGVGQRGPGDDWLHDRDRTHHRSVRRGEFFFSRSSSPTCSSSCSDTAERAGRLRAWARKSLGRASSAATGSSSGSARAAWAKCGARSIGCSPGRPRSSSSGRRWPATPPATIPITSARRFEREAQVTAELRSPHTVELCDFGVADDGAFYYVMELLDGLDLEALVASASGRCRPSAPIHLVRQVCHSLAEAQESRPRASRHQAGEHLRLPVRRRRRLREGAGLRHRESRGRDVAADTMLQTMDTKVQGTPAFIAPEQALGQAGHRRASRHLCDRLRAVLVTDRTARVHGGHGRWDCSCITRTPRPCRRRVAVEIAIPSSLDALVMSCLAKNPADRPQSARELSQRLERVPASTPGPTSAPARGGTCTAHRAR